MIARLIYQITPNYRPLATTYTSSLNHKIMDADFLTIVIMLSTNTITWISFGLVKFVYCTDLRFLVLF